MSNPTSALLVIGNEVLSGRTQDANIRHIATRLGEIGLPLREVRVIPDVADTIVRTIREVREKFDHVFTTGGIGPTHDDITSECVARAFDVPWEPHPEAMALLGAVLEARGVPFNPALQRMATIPRGATLIANAVSAAPGFSIGNVHVMAGVPSIMRAMLDALLPTLPAGARVQSRAVHAIDMTEGAIAAPLEAIARAHPELDLGSYPFRRDGHYGVAIVAKGTDLAEVERAQAEVRRMIERGGFSPVEGEPPE